MNATERDGGYSRDESDKLFYAAMAERAEEAAARIEEDARGAIRSTLFLGACKESEHGLAQSAAYITAQYRSVLSMAAIASGNCTHVELLERINGANRRARRADDAIEVLLDAVRAELREGSQ